jgi:hypothetical protein
MLKTYLSLFFIFLFALGSFAQNGQIKLEYIENPKTVGGEIEVNIVIFGGNQYEVGEFPEFKALKKGARSIKHYAQVISGKKETVHTIKQVYISEEGGKIIIPVFDLEINNKLNRFEGRTLNFEKEENIAIVNIIEVEDVKLIVETSKQRVFVGEGLVVNMSLIISKSTTTDWEFPENISEQIEAIAKKIKPKDCIENRKVISNISSKVETINGKSYDVYTLYQSIFYPLNKNSFVLPVLSLKMKKFKNDKPIDVILNSNQQGISVVDLPVHPLKEKVAVGFFSIQETLKGGKNKVTGEAFEYSIQVNGNGNLSTFSPTERIEDPGMEIFLSNTKLNQNLGSSDGSKIFSFKIIPKKLGKIELKDYFNFIFFNSISERYDTLFAKKAISVSGEKIEYDEEVEKDIFEGIDELSTQGSYINLKLFLRILANLFWLAIFSGFIYLLFYFKK